MVVAADGDVTVTDGLDSEAVGELIVADGAVIVAVGV